MPTNSPCSIERVRPLAQVGECAAEALLVQPPSLADILLWQPWRMRAGGRVISLNAAYHGFERLDPLQSPHSLRWRLRRQEWLWPTHQHIATCVPSILPMQTTVLRANKLPWWDEQLVTVLYRVASLHPSQDLAIAVAFSDEAGEVYRTATINGARQLACLGRELNALSLVPRAARANSPQASVAVVFGLRSIEQRKF